MSNSRTMEAQPQSTTVASRRGRHLLPVQTTAPASPTLLAAKSPQHRPALPRPEDVERVPLRAPKSQSSRSSLRNLFLRQRPSRSSIPSSDSSLPAVIESEALALPSPRSVAATAPSPTTPTSVSKRFSREMPPQPLHSSSSNSSLKPAKPISAWNPPPLFKAYPQALKHATLPTPNIPPETILRIDDYRRITAARRDHATPDGETKASSKEHATLKKNQHAKIQRHARKISSSMNKVEWSQKIYMLVTSGCLLQYDADGSFDRHPEKLMELSKDSVAFACDALPGKHWVLQVSQTVDSKSAPPSDTRPTLFNRLSFADSHKVTKTMFLVFETPEELATWITLVRKEIDSLGGKAYSSNSPTHNGAHPEDLHRFQSFRVNRRSARFEQPRAPLESPKLEGGTPQRSLTSEHSTRPKDIKTNGRVTQAPSEAVSLSTAGTTTELDGLRGGSRSSHTSGGTRTMPSSSSSSPSTAPKLMLPTKEKDSLEVSFKSDAGTVLPVEGDSEESNSRPRSFVALQTSTPNFSRPSFAKRYSTVVETGMSPPPSRSAPPRPPRSPLLSDSTQCTPRPDTSTQIELQLPEDNMPTRTPVVPLAKSRSIDEKRSTHSSNLTATRRLSSYDGGQRPLPTTSEPVPQLPRSLHDIDIPTGNLTGIAPDEPRTRPKSLVTPRLRPYSMQPSPSLVSPGRQSNDSNVAENPPHLPLRQHTEDQLRSSKRLSAHRSMPLLTHGPPPVPPPDCPLPEVPSQPDKSQPPPQPPPSYPLPDTPSQPSSISSNPHPPPGYPLREIPPPQQPPPNYPPPEPPQPQRTPSSASSSARISHIPHPPPRYQPPEPPKSPPRPQTQPAASSAPSSVVTSPNPHPPPTYPLPEIPQHNPSQPQLTRPHSQHISPSHSSFLPKGSQRSDKRISYISTGSLSPANPRMPPSNLVLDGTEALEPTDKRSKHDSMINAF